MTLECRTTGVPTCFGTCVNSSFCQCSEGYIHDAILMKYRNCGLSVSGLDAYCWIALIFCILGGLVNLYIGKGTLKNSILRKLSIAAICTDVFFAAMTADLLINRRLTTQALVFYVLSLNSVCFTFSYLLLSILLPVSKISRKIAGKFVPWRRFWLVFIPSFCVFGATLTFLGAFVFTAPGDDDTFNNWLIGQAAMFVVLCLVAVPAFTSFTGILIRGLNQALNLGIMMDEDEERSSSRVPPRRKSSTNDPDFGAATLQRQTFVKVLLAKVLFIRKAVWSGGFMLMTLSAIALGLQIFAGMVPLFWAVFVTGPFGVAIFTLVIASYTRKRRESERRKSMLIPFFGRQLSGLSKRKHSLFGSTPGSDVEEGGNGEQSPARLLLDVPSTVKEEPSHMAGSWAEGSGVIKVAFDMPGTPPRSSTGRAGVPLNRMADAPLA